METFVYHVRILRISQRFSENSDKFQQLSKVSLIYFPQLLKIFRQFPETRFGDGFTYLAFQENKVESLNCRELSSLAEILLSENNLTSLQGLVGCPNLRHLDLNKNKITRIGKN